MWKQSTMLKAGMLPRGTRSTLLLPRGAFPTTTTNTNNTDETSYYSAGNSLGCLHYDKSFFVHKISG
jgi:hypothetical protein